MPTDNTQILVAQMARVWLAPVGTAAPADEVVAMGSDWRDVGLFTPDSLRLNDAPTFDTVQSHQSFYPTRRFQTAQAATVQVDLQQFSAKNLTAVMGGGTVSQVVSGHFKYTPPRVGGRSAISAVLEIIDGIRNYRYVVPNAQQTEANQMDFRRSNETILPLRLSILGSDVGDPWYLLTNDPTFDPTFVA